MVYIWCLQNWRPNRCQRSSGWQWHRTTAI